MRGVGYFDALRLLVSHTLVELALPALLALPISDDRRVAKRHLVGGDARQDGCMNPVVAQPDTLKALLKERGVTQAALARACRMYPDVVCRQLNGRRPLNAAVLEGISKLTGRALDELPVDGLRLADAVQSAASRRGWDNRRR